MEQSYQLQDSANRIPIYEVKETSDGFQLKVTNEAAAFFSKISHNNVLPICCGSSGTEQLLGLLSKGKINKLQQHPDQRNIFVVDCPLELKQDLTGLLIEIPENSADAANTQDSFGYLALSFALYIAKYTLLPLAQAVQAKAKAIEIATNFLKGNLSNPIESSIILDPSELINEGSLELRRIEGCPLKGAIVMFMVCEFQQAIQTKKALDIVSSLQAHSIVYFSKVKEELFNQFLASVKTQLDSSKFPFESQFITDRLALIEENLMIQYDQRVAGFSQLSPALQQRQELEEKITTEKQEIIKKNNEISQEFCTNLLVQVYEHFTQQNVDALTSSSRDLSETTLLEKQQEFQELLKIYLSLAKGPFKYKLLAETQAKFTFDFFQKFFTQIHEQFTAQIIQTKSTLLEVQEKLQTSDIKLKSAEQQKLDLEQIVKKYQAELKDKTLLASQLQQSKLMESKNDEKLQTKTQKLEKKQLKIANMLEKANQLSQEFKKLKDDSAEKDIKLSCLEDKLSKYEDLAKSVQRSTDFSMVFRNQSDLSTTLKDFKFYVERAEDSIMQITNDRASYSTNTQKEVDTISKKDNEIAALKEERHQLLQQMEDEKIKAREIFDKERIELEEQIQRLSTEKDDLLKQAAFWKIMELDFNQARSELDDQSRQLVEQNKMHQITIELLKSQMGQLEEQAEMAYKARQELIIQKTLVGDQALIIENIYKLLPHLILHLKGKPNKLIMWLKCLQPHTQEVANILQECGIKLN